MLWVAHGAWVLWVFLAVVWLIDALRLRARATLLPALAPSETPTSADHVFVTRAGVVLDASVQQAASAYAHAQGLEVLDVVPRQMPAARALFFLQTVDVPRYRQDRFAPGGTAGEAFLVTRALAERMGLDGAAPPPDLVAMTHLARRLAQYAPLTMGHAIAPRLSCAADAPNLGRDLLTLGFGELAVTIVRIQCVLAVLGPFVAPIAGGAALGILHLHASLALGGTSLSVAGLPGELVLRSVLDFLRTFRRTTAPPSPPVSRRDAYAALLTDGTSRFFEPRREDCPLCGDRALRRALEVGDLFQRKPGRFTIDRCGGCGHLFQNPRLSLDGLDFYYRDFYDGLGEAGLELIFAATTESYLSRVRAVLGALPGPPGSWLDVGTGHGHFAHAARELLPQTTFDGVDLAASIEEAERRRWLRKGHRGLFPELAPALATEGYAVVSMSHYLEHTRDPQAELRAAAQVLGPHGVLMIEVPDPESRFGRLLGRFWLPWFQPQHQHLLSAARLETLLDANGFTTVTWHRGEAHQPSDFFLAAGLLVHTLGPPHDLPWAPVPGPLARLRSKIVWTVSLPLLFAARIADIAVAPLVRRPGWANTMRVVAKKRAA